MDQKPLSDLLGDLDSLAAKRSALEAELSVVNAQTSETIKAARRSAGVSQSWLADASGRTQAYVSQVESGTTGATPSTLSAFGAALAGAAIEGGTDGQQEGRQGKHADGRADAQAARRKGSKRTRH